MIAGLQKKVTFLEGWLYKNLSEDENLQELLKEVSEEHTSGKIFASRTSRFWVMNFSLQNSPSKHHSCEQQKKPKLISHIHLDYFLQCFTTI